MTDPKTLTSLGDLTIDPTGTDAGTAPCLTVAYHPDMRRAGEQSRLNSLNRGERVSLSRLHPEFVGIGSPPEPLADPYLSRKPAWITPRGETLTFSLEQTTAEMRIDGVRIDRPHTISRRALKKGLVLQLGNRIVLFFHETDQRPRPASVGGLLGVSDTMGELQRAILDASGDSGPVLVSGPTGAGTTRVARALHDLSPRRGAAFVTVSLNHLQPAAAIEVLFGGQGSDGGKFAAARGGTLVLDDLTTFPEEMIQALTEALVPEADVRLIVALEQDPDTLSLPAALDGQRITVPPLCARRADIGLLFMHFLSEALEGTPEHEKLLAAPQERRPWLPADLVARLIRYDWPGNVRQLKSVARRLASTGRGEDGLAVTQVVERLLPALATVAASSHAPESRPTLRVLSDGKTMDDIPFVKQLRAIRKGTVSPGSLGDDQVLLALRANRWSESRTAKALGITKAALQTLVSRNKYVRKGEDLSEDEVVRARAACGGNIKLMVELLEVPERVLRERMADFH